MTDIKFEIIKKIGVLYKSFWLREWTIRIDERRDRYCGRNERVTRDVMSEETVDSNPSRPSGFEDRYRLYLDVSGDNVFRETKEIAHRFLCLLGCWFQNPGRYFIRLFPICAIFAPAKNACEESQYFGLATSRFAGASDENLGIKALWFNQRRVCTLRKSADENRLAKVQPPPWHK